MKNIILYTFVGFACLAAACFVTFLPMLLIIWFEDPIHGFVLIGWVILLASIIIGNVIEDIIRL